MHKKQGMIGIAIVIMVVVAGAAGALILINSDDDPMGLRVTYSNKVDYEPLIIASDLGFFEDEGVNVDLLIVKGGIESAEAMLTGSADLGAMGEGPTVTLMSKDPTARLLARYGGGEGQHRMIASKDIADVTDLVGKKVGVQFGSTTHGALLRLLEKEGVDPSMVELVPLKPSEMPDAMYIGSKNGGVDAMMGSEPWPTNVETKCGDKVHEIADSSGLGSNFPLTLIATEKIVKEKPEAVAAFMRAIDRAIDHIHENYTDAAEICAKYTGLSPANQQKCMDSLFYDMDITREDIENLNSTAQFLLENKKIEAAPNIAERVDDSFLRQLQGRA